MEMLDDVLGIKYEEFTLPESFSILILAYFLT